MHSKKNDIKLCSKDILSYYTGFVNRKSKNMLIFSLQYSIILSSKLFRSDNNENIFG